MNEPNHRTVNVSISLPPRLRDAARQAAFDDNRSFSSLVAWLLKEHLKQDGYLEERRPAFRFRRERRHAAANIFFRPADSAPRLKIGNFN